MYLNASYPQLVKPAPRSEHRYPAKSTTWIAVFTGMPNESEAPLVAGNFRKAISCNFIL
jgi:hypothetical protein